MTYANKTLRNEYRVKAHGIGGNAINLVNDFFKCGIDDDIEKPIGNGWVEVSCHQWTLTDLDGALDEMGRVK